MEYFFFYAKVTAKLPEGFTIKLQAIIKYEGVQHPKSCNYISPHKLLNIHVPNISQCLSLCPFGEVIYSY